MTSKQARNACSFKNKAWDCERWVCCYAPSAHGRGPSSYLQPTPLSLHRNGCSVLTVPTAQNRLLAVPGQAGLSTKMRHTQTTLVTHRWSCWEPRSSTAGELCSVRISSAYAWCLVVSRMQTIQGTHSLCELVLVSSQNCCLLFVIHTRTKTGERHCSSSTAAAARCQCCVMCHVSCHEQTRNTRVVRWCVCK